jgi:hypothetical protein
MLEVSPGAEKEKRSGEHEDWTRMGHFGLVQEKTQVDTTRVSAKVKEL